MEERLCVSRDSRSIRDAGHDFSLRVAGNPSPFSSVSHLGVPRDPDVGQGKAELLSPIPLPGSTKDPSCFVLCWSLHQDSGAETPGDLVLIRVIKSCPAAVLAFIVNPGS